MPSKVLFLLATLFATPALATTSFYTGLRVGSDLDGRLQDAGAPIETDTPFGAYAGWRINENFALEFGATSLGSSTRSGIADAGLDLDGAVYQLGLVASIPVAENFELLGGAGAFRLDEDGEAITIAGPVPIDASESGAYVEVGGRYLLNQQWSLRAGYTWYDFDAGGDGNVWGGVQLDF